jgi:predicted small secreted protein
MKKLMTYILILSFSLLTLSACSTISGIGKDITRAAGQTAQNQD